MLEFIRSKVSEEKRYMQLAEEAAELAQASLKVCRTMSDENPTPVTREEAMEKLYEEIADVDLALLALGLMDNTPQQKVQAYVLAKFRRWNKRLKETVGEEKLR